ESVPGEGGGTVAMAALSPTNAVGSTNDLGAYVDLGGERPMHRAFVRDLEEAGELLVAQLSLELEIPFDAIQLTGLRFTLRAVDRVNFRVPQPDRHCFERPPLASSVERHGHRRAGAEGGEQEVVGGRSRLGSAELHGLVGDQAVTADGDLLDE